MGENALTLLGEAVAEVPRGMLLLGAKELAAACSLSVTEANRLLGPDGVLHGQTLKYKRRRLIRRCDVEAWIARGCPSGE